VEIEEIKKELQGTQRSHLSETEDEQLERLYTINDEEKEQNSEPTTVAEMETHKQRSVICKLKGKIKCTYYQVTQTESDKRPRWQEHQIKFCTEMQKFVSLLQGWARER
jgi:RPA family protein